ncbi:MAG: S1 RNA-binding domain-containing protein, partial [Methylococcaceae bacterium]
NDLPREKLKFIIEEYGRSAIRDPNRCRELLREHAPENLRETNLLMLVLTEGFVWELTAENLEVFSQRLHDEFGTKEEFAFWAVKSWAWALNLINIPMIQKITEEDVIELPEKEIFSINEDEIETNSPIQKIESIDSPIEKEQHEEFWRIAEGKYFPPEYEIERRKAWIEIENAFENNTTVTGYIKCKVSGGFTVKIGFLNAFLPASLAYDAAYSDLGGKHAFEFKIVNIDQNRKSIVLSLHTRQEKQCEELKIFQEGDVVVGIVKNITDYGAFIDLGYIDGLLHANNMAWKRVRHPSEYVTVGQEIKVKVLEYDKDKNRVSLGMKQMQENPWQNIMQRYSVGAHVFGKVNHLTDYGCFVDIENGIEGFIHVSEMDWGENVNPSELVKLGDEIELIILEIDEELHRIALSIKQCNSHIKAEFEHPKLLNSTTLKLKAKNTSLDFIVPLLKDEATQDFEDMF